MEMRRALALGLALAGCRHDTPCMRMMDPSPLLLEAALLRLDIYDETAHCSGATLEPAAPPPIASTSAAGGQPLKIAVPSGHHVLLLSAFADSAATTLLGSACTESDFAAGGAACFNLTVEEVPDASVAPPDGAGGPDLERPRCTAAPDNCGPGTYCASDGSCAAGCKNAGDCAAPKTKCDIPKHVCVECLVPGDCALGKRCSPSGACVDGCDVAAGSLCMGSLMCCSNLCLDTTMDLSSCGACGRPCSSLGVVTPACLASLCTPACSSGLLDCSHPIAPAADDGCESSANDVAHCGGCGNVCALQNASAATCPAGVCGYTCASGFGDCVKTGANTDGCETAITTTLNCGACNANCGLSNATSASCPSGQCAFACQNGFGDCVKTGANTDGCETDVTSSTANCGGCARPCSSAGVVTPICTGSLCKPTCTGGLLDCNHPIAPAADDGCETSANDPAHCGSCTNPCNLPNATAACPAGSCTIASCAANNFDCNATAGDGCECPGKDLLDGMKGCCAGGTCQALHSDGNVAPFGHSFYDCIAFGTYTLQLAKDAAAAYNLTGATDNFVDATNSFFCVRRRPPPAGPTQECVCWAFAGATIGFAKHVNAECLAPTIADVAWK